MIAGIILAAGASQRMGEPKALLNIGNETFLQRIVRMLHSARVTTNVIVLGAHYDQVVPALGWFDGKVIKNSEWKNGQLSSLLTGIDSFRNDTLHGFFVCPIDHPLLVQSTLVELLQGFWKSNKNIIVPTFHGKRGHPVIFGVSMVDALRSASLQEGAKAVVRKYTDEVLEIPVNNDGILQNIDTPEDYETKILKRFS